MNLAELADTATVVGAIIAVTALLFTAYEVHQNRKTNRARFWLDLEKMFSRHDEVHWKLRPGGEWTKNGVGPSKVEEWAKVEDYMGLFEHCMIMLDKGLIDWETFKKIFGYRVSNIMGNQKIVSAKLQSSEKEYWKDFIRLVRCLGYAELLSPVMPRNVTISLPEELTKRMEGLPEVNWSEVCREAILNYIQAREVPKKRQRGKQRKN